MTAVQEHTLSMLDFQLPCESEADGSPCQYEAPAEWVLAGTPPCGHHLSILLCDYCRLDFQQFCLHAAKLRGTFCCHVCRTPLGVPLFDVYRLAPLRGT